jgi:hypothetical protein
MDKSECLELKNIKYQTMLLNSNSKIVSTKKNSENLDDFLQKEKAQNKSKPWSKLGRSTKLKKLEVFVTQFAIEKKLTDIEKKQLHSYLNTSLDRKKLQRVKDVNYDVKTGRIKAIPGLTYNKNKHKYTLRRVDKKKSTLKGLAPKRKKDKIDIKDKI